MWVTRTSTGGCSSAARAGSWQRRFRRPAWTKSLRIRKACSVLGACRQACASGNDLNRIARRVSAGGGTGHDRVQLAALDGHRSGLRRLRHAVLQRGLDDDDRPIRAAAAVAPGRSDYLLGKGRQRRRRHRPAGQAGRIRELIDASPYVRRIASGVLRCEADPPAGRREKLMAASAADCNWIISTAFCRWSTRTRASRS